MASVTGRRVVLAAVVVLLTSSLAVPGVVAGGTVGNEVTADRTAGDGIAADGTATDGIAAGGMAPERPAGDRSSTGAGPLHERSAMEPDSADRDRAPEPGRPSVEVPSSASATVTESGGQASVTGTATAVQDAGATLTAHQELRLTPDDRGSIDVTVSYDVPDSVTTLRTAVPEDATVTGTSGFSQSEGTTYEWGGEAAAPSVTYTLSVNETRELAGPEGASGEYLFVDVGEWALVRRPVVSTTWGWRGGEPVALSRESETAGPGFVGDWIVYMGRHETHERRAHGQRFRLVVPERATLAESPKSILDSLSTASDQLRVGDRDDRVTAVAAPTTAVRWGVRGLQFGEADMWVRDAEPLDTVENTWLHEYVHTRQDYEPSAGARWTTEGMATYYAALLAVNQDRAELSEFGPFIGRGTVPPQASAVLSEPGSWANAANYWKGALVAGDVDRRIREATDSERSLQAVFSRLNADPDAVTREDFETAVADLAGGAVRSSLVAFTTSDRHPEMWSRATHERVFGSIPARVSVTYADADDAFTVSGPYRNATLDPRWRVGQTIEGSKLTAYEGETVTVLATVANAGGAATEYEARFAVDDRVVDSRSGSIRPGQTASHTFERTFEEPGDYVLAVGSDEVAVEVFEPARANVTALDANRTTLSGPGTVELAATVTNDHGVPARSNLTLTLANETVFDRQVAVGPNDQRVVRSTARLTEPGEYTITLGNAEDLVVTVENREQSGGGGDGGSSSFGPGFGVGPALLALLGALVAGALLARRR